jgi:galactokinase
MDQMACSVGGMVHIDFADPANPVVEPVAFDIAKHGYSLCITDTKGSHADLTDDYAAIPVEMKQVAAFFGKDFLHEVSKEDLMKNLAAIREKTNDRAVLRALHFVEENERVKAEVAALKADDIAAFLATVNTSGNSSYKYLQNVYTNHDVEHQNVSIALCVSEMVLGENGVCRVHGGGFAGTIQAFVKDTAVADYQAQMNAIFGEGACSVLKIRKYGGMLVMK